MQLIKSIHFTIVTYSATTLHVLNVVLSNHWTRGNQTECCVIPRSVCYCAHLWTVILLNIALLGVIDACRIGEWSLMISKIS